MTCCAHCRVIDGKFGRKAAESDLRRYHRRGPDDTTRLILDMLRHLEPADIDLLDVGGGIGIIAHELMIRGVRAAILVEAAAAYLEAAAEEAKRRGNIERLRLLHGDFVDIAREVPRTDVVTLDRVVCCYPDYRRLLAAAGDKTRRALAISYPRDRWHVRLVIALQNLGRRLLRDRFQTFVHPQDEMHGVLSESGLRLREVKDGFVWHVALYVRDGDGSTA